MRRSVKTASPQQGRHTAELSSQADGKKSALFALDRTQFERIMSVGQEFAVSAVAAGLSHVIHHPLYMLKSQMMYYGPEFSLWSFLKDARKQPRGFLYRGIDIIFCSNSVTHRA